MAKKMDKEALKKNQFWIGLGVFVFLWFVAVIVVVASGGPSADQTNYEGKLKAIDQARKNRPKSKLYQDPWNEHGEKFRNHKDKVWAEAWDLQKEPRIAAYVSSKDKGGHKDKVWVHEKALADAGWAERVGPSYLPTLYSWNSTETFPLETSLEFPESAFPAPWRGQYRAGLYKEQFDDLGTYLVQFPYVPQAVLFKGKATGHDVVPLQSWDGKDDLEPTREEVWLAQEDFWVRREMLLMMREALETASRFHEIKDEPDGEKTEKPKGEKAEKPKEGARRFRLRNANWELDLVVVKGTGHRWTMTESKIKNIHPSKRPQLLAYPESRRGVVFRVTQLGIVAEPKSKRVLEVPSTTSFWLEVRGEPLAYGKEWTFTKEVEDFDFDKAFVVHQVYERETSPVREIVALDVPQQSNRTVTTGLKVREDLKALDPQVVEKGADKGAAKGAGPTGMAAPGALGGGEGDGDAGGADVTTRYGISRQRYLHVTPQCRHLPIAMRLIVDEAHIHDVLGAVTNSRLRVQITQVQLNRAADYKPGMAPEATTGTGPGTGGGIGPRSKGGKGMPGGPPGGKKGRGPSKGPGSFPGGLPRGPGMGMPKGPGMGMPKGPGMGMPRGPGTGIPQGPAGQGTPSTAAQTESNSTLMEVTIYGIAALYTKPRANQPAAPGAQPAAPGPGAQPAPPGKR